MGAQALTQCYLRLLAGGRLHAEQAHLDQTMHGRGLLAGTAGSAPEGDRNAMWANGSKLTRRLVSVQALTQYHLVLLAGGRLHAVNRVSGKTVQEIALGGAVGGAPALGLAADQAAGTIYLFTGA